MLAILVPMAIEATGIRRGLRRIPDSAATLHIGGVGQTRITAAVARLAAAPQRPDAIILAGCCGALEPTLNTGDIHLPPSFRIPESDATIAADARLLAALINAAADGIDTTVTSSPSVTVAAIAQPDAKADLRCYGATVNMEDYHAARAAASAGIPFAAVRAVLDTAGQSLPAGLDAAAGRPGRIAAGLARHPALLPELVRLRRQMLLTRRSLTRCVMAAVRAHQSEMLAVDNLTAATPAAETPAGVEAAR